MVDRGQILSGLSILSDWNANTGSSFERTSFEKWLRNLLKIDYIIFWNLIIYSFKEWLHDIRFEKWLCNLLKEIDYIL